MGIKSLVFERIKRLTPLILPVLFISLLLLGSTATNIVRADTFDEQIRTLNNQNNQTRQANNALETEEQSLQATLNRLQGEISAVENQINENRTQRDETTAKIAKAEVELAKQQALIGDSIRAMYVEGNISTVEMLASSKNLSDFVDKQQYRNSVQNKIKTTLDTIKELKQELDDQKSKLDQLIADQQNMQAQLDGQRAEQSRLLGLNQSQQTAYNQEIQATEAEIADLRRQQIAANARFTGGSSGGGARYNVPDSSGYPWAGVSFPNSMPDPWGMYKRQCVSYTAWKVWKSGRHMPYWGGRGNAKLWDDNARAAGIPVDGNPRVGDVAVSNFGRWGHVMYVEAVHGDGTITISQYNASWDGRYSEARISVGSLVFIHF